MARTAINFSEKYSKLLKDEFTTVRWIDYSVEIGKSYNIFYVAPNMFHTHYGKGKMRVVKLEVKRLGDLTEEFCATDADCTKPHFMEKMKGWYGKKPDWKGEDSEVLVISMKRVQEEMK